MQTTGRDNNIVFYDGECGFCNSSVQFILNHKKAPFYFVSLQSSLAKTLLAPYNITIQLDTIYYLKNGMLYDKSSAVLQITKRLKGAYPALFVFYILPKFFRDIFYNFIAKRRHRIKKGYCAIPSPDDLRYFIKEEEA